MLKSTLNDIMTAAGAGDRDRVEQLLTEFALGAVYDSQIQRELMSEERPNPSEDIDPNEPIPGVDVSPFGMSPTLMNYRLRKLTRRLSDEDRLQGADLIERLVAEIEMIEAKKAE